MSRLLLALLLAVLAAAPAGSQTALPVSDTDLIRDHLYVSPSGGHFLLFRPDGDLVVADTDGQIVWGLAGAGVPVQGAARVAMQPDGNLAVYAADGAFLWSALTERPDPTARLTISPDGDLQLVADGGPVWSSRLGVLRSAPPAASVAAAVAAAPVGAASGRDGSVACAAAPDAAGGMLEPGRTPSFLADVSCLEWLAHEAVNRAREAAGLAPLRWSDAYAAVARAHSGDMVRRGFFAHDTPEGTTFFQRMEAAELGCSGPPAENIAGAYAIGIEIMDMDGEVVSVEWLARAALGEAPVAQWMGSPPHRRNLLNPAYAQHAIGLAWDAETQRFLATQLLCE